MATESGTYTPEVIARRLKIAEAMLGDGPPIQHWAQGLNELAKGAIGGNIYRNAERSEQEGQAGQYAALAAILGGGGQPGAAAVPQSADPRAITSAPRSSVLPPLEAPAETAPVQQPPVQPVRQAMEGVVPQNQELSYEAGGVGTRPPQEQIVAAMRRAAGLPPVGQAPQEAAGVTAQPPGTVTPPAPREAMAGAPAGTPNAAPGGEGPSGDIKARIAQMLQDKNPYVRRQGAELAKQVVGTMLKSESTELIKNFEYAKQRGFPGSLQDWARVAKGENQDKFGLQPIWGTDKDGKPVILQLSGSGVAGQTRLPEGVTPSTRNLMKVDTGTHINFIDPITRQVVSSTPKDIEGKESAEERGKALGLGQVDLPRVIGNAEQALQVIDKIRKHPGKEWGVGSTGWVPGIPGTQQKDFVSLVDQAKGKAFLEAFNSLKGGGQITEIEGKKATDAIARLDRTQSKDGFDEALKDLEDVIKQGMDRARIKAGQGAAPAASGGGTGGVRRYNPATGKIE